MRAIKKYDKYLKYSKGNIKQVKVWEFPKTKKQPEGIKYHFAYIHNGKRVLGYDNEIGKGHHKHLFGKETKIIFKGIKELYNQFIKEVKQLRKKLLEDKK